MSSALIIRIIGGVCGGAIGTYISGHIYDYLNRNRQPIPQKPLPPPEKYESKFKEAKTFEEILNNQVNEYINNQNSKNDYEYDNEEGNTFNINIKKTEETYVNDTLYDCNFYDFYAIVGRDNQ
jgi:hypothetical protein